MSSLRWTSSHFGAPTAYGFDGNYLVAQIAHYDNGGGRWRAYLRGEPVNGPVPTRDAARALAESAHLNGVIGG